eukprot:TRINITY_DN17895_c0_g1_i2.p2 TRINITY_DN17895_c0_g1~~TRINITY_DN17895_c0_g1_i2.p2  ORF type:complete len:393 (-),score=89.85 TRINITY_DN17895_c0_g1_i2:73-1206(-)
MAALAAAPLAAAAVPSAAAPVSAVADDAVPRKRINSPEDLDVFLKSRLCQQLVSFAGELSEAVKGLPVAADRTAGASVLMRELSAMLSELEGWIDDIPPLAQPMRFGNKAFTQWHSRLVERGEGLLAAALRADAAAGGGAQKVDIPELARELSHYLAGSFGDPRRIDYGTGHEAAFLALLFALGAKGVLAKADAADAVLVVFAAYVRVMRKLQNVYVLEPAGSHGVWGLDDFHALPFLFGAAQLIGLEDEIPTGEVYKDRVIREYADGYLYVDAIRQVLLAKRGAPFHETSPMLYDITAVPTWQKTHAGLVKMYRAEVLGKYPVIQHFLFGPTLRWPGDEAASQGPSAGHAAGAVGAGAMPPPTCLPPAATMATRRP